MEAADIATPSRRAQKAASEARYTADLTGGSLKLAESRLIADLLLRRVDARSWKDAIYTRNILKARRPATAKRLANLIRSRLETMESDLWKLVRDGNVTVANHALLAASVKHSRLLGDFIRLVVAEEIRTLSTHLSKSNWDEFLAGCQERDASMPEWSAGTKKRLRSSVFQALAQAGYIESTKTLKLQAVHISEAVVRYLMSHRETYVLRSLQVAE